MAGASEEGALVASRESCVLHWVAGAGVFSGSTAAAAKATAAVGLKKNAESGSPASVPAMTKVDSLKRPSRAPKKTGVLIHFGPAPISPPIRRGAPYVDESRGGDSVV